MKFRLSKFTWLALILLLTGTACRSPYYKAMESLGIAKRDILIDRVKEGKESQEEAKEQFADALEKFIALTEFDGGNLEKVYNRLKKELERSEKKAQEVTERIESIEDVADELFDEWEDELREYDNEEYRRISENQLERTMTRYEELVLLMKNARKSAEPVLTTFRDQVLFLKHNLNAQAIASLDTQVEVLRSDIQLLIRDIEVSIAEADAFIETMNQLRD